MKHLSAITLACSFVLMGFAIKNLLEYEKKDELIQLQQIQIRFLKDYKRAYMEHIPKCDTLHRYCFRNKAR